MGLVGLTVIQRARIRAQYRINGSVGNDIVKSLFCGPCAMMQHDREVRAREGDEKLAKDGAQYNELQMTQTQPAKTQPMRYPLQRAVSAENPGVENRIFRKQQSGKPQKRYTDSELEEVPAEAMMSADELCGQILNSQKLNDQKSDCRQHTQNCEVEAMRNHTLMQKHKNTINAMNSHPVIGKVDGTTSSRLKTRTGSEKNSLTSLTNCCTLVGEPGSLEYYLHEPNPKDSEKISRINSRGQLSYVHDFSDSSATKIYLDHYADEGSDLQENGTVRRLVRSSERNSLRTDLNAAHSIRSSSSSTIRQHSLREAVVDTSLLESANQNRIDSCGAESVDSAWLLDMPVQHRVSSCSVIAKNPCCIREFPEQYRVLSCPATPETSTAGNSVRSASKDLMLTCTIETAPPSSSSSSVMPSCTVEIIPPSCSSASTTQHKSSNSMMNAMDDAEFSAPLFEYSQYSHLLGEKNPESNPLIFRSPSKNRASSCTAISTVASQEQHSLQDCLTTASGDSTPAAVKQHRVSSCCASIPSGNSNTNGECGSHMLEDCKFSTGSAATVPSNQHRLTSCRIDSSSPTRRSLVANPPATSYSMEDSCLFSGAASPVRQHRAASCDGFSFTPSSNFNVGDFIGVNNEFEDGCLSSGSSTPKPRQHRAVSCIASCIITECEEHLLEDCEYDSKVASPLPQHDIADCDASFASKEERSQFLQTVVEEEQEHLLVDCAGNSGPPTPLRQHRIVSCDVSSPSRRTSVAEQHRLVSCPGYIPGEGNRSQNASHDSRHLSRGSRVDARDNNRSTQKNYEDCLHTLDECITPADRAKMEANASQDTEYEKYSMRVSNHFKNRSNDFNEKSDKRKETRSPSITNIASHESESEFTLAQVLSLEEETDLMCVTQIDGDGTMSIASRRSAALPPAPFPTPTTSCDTPIEPLNIIGAYPAPITPLNIKKEKKRIPSENSSAGSGFASYFGFGGSRK